MMLNLDLLVSETQQDTEMNRHGMKPKCTVFTH